MMLSSRKGWFKLPGQEGDRSVADQMRGLAPALEAAKGKTVLDLGCAEGAIALEFAKAGAARVLGLELMPSYLDVARDLCRGYPCEFQCVDLNRAEAEVQRAEFDVVLALAVIHKLREPAKILRYFADMARELLVIRMPGFAYGTPPVAFQSERFDRDIVDVAKILAHDFVLWRVERGPHLERGLEPVLYFKRISTGAA